MKRFFSLILLLALMSSSQAVHMEHNTEIQSDNFSESSDLEADLSKGEVYTTITEPGLFGLFFYADAINNTAEKKSVTITVYIDGKKRKSENHSIEPHSEISIDRFYRTNLKSDQWVEQKIDADANVIIKNKNLAIFALSKTKL